MPFFGLKPKSAFAVTGCFLQVVVDLCAFFAHGKPMHTVCMQATHEPKKWALLNNCAGVEPVENPHFQVWHAHTPHKVEVLRTDWVQVCIAITHFLHVHVMHIALHTNGQVHLWLIGVRLSVCVYETVQPPATYTTTQLPLTTLPAHGGVWFSHNKVPFNTVSLVY